MPAIKFETFDGIAPVFDPRQLRSEQSQTADNVDLLGGALVPIKKMKRDETLDSATAKTIYKYNNQWLSWNTIVNIVSSPVFGERYNRIYYTGAASKMKVRGYDADPSTAVEDPNTIVERDIGVPKPTTAVLASAVARSDITWYFKWTAYWEQNDGAIYQLTTPATGVDVITLGSVYEVQYPNKVSATPNDAKVMVYADVYSDSGLTQLVGRMYMNESAYRGSSDAFVKGVKLKASIVPTDVAGKTRYRRVNISFDDTFLTTQFYTTDRFYLMTYVNKWGEQGAASPVSLIVTVKPNQLARLTGLGTAAPTGFETQIYKKRIYRSAVSAVGTKYQFVAEIAATVDTYDDLLYDGELQEVLPSQFYEAPPEGLQGLVAMPQGFFAAFKGSTVYFSEPYQPHAWPSRYALTVEDRIVTLAVNGNSLFVLTEKIPVAITGNAPGSMSQSALPSNYSATSLRGVLVMNDNIIYATNVGLVAIRGFESVLLTRRIFDKKQWQALNPSTMFFEEHQNRIYVFHDKGVITFYPRAAISEYVDNQDITTVFGVTTANRVVGSALNDHTTDTLYVTVGAGLFNFSGDALNDRLKYKTKELYFDKPISFACLRVSADGYPVTVNIYADGRLAQVVTVTGDATKKLPFIRKAKSWELEVIAETTVRGFSIGNAVGDM
jgi:hypothetical protein